MIPAEKERALTILRAVVDLAGPDAYTQVQTACIELGLEPDVPPEIISYAIRNKAIILIDGMSSWSTPAILRRLNEIKDFAASTWGIRLELTIHTPKNILTTTINFDAELSGSGLPGPFFLKVFRSAGSNVWRVKNRAVR